MPARHTGVAEAAGFGAADKGEEFPPPGAEVRARTVADADAEFSYVVYLVSAP